MRDLGAGAEALQRHVDRTVELRLMEFVCDAPRLRQRRIGERCMAHAMSKAVDQIGSVDLTARFLVEYRYYVHERELQVAQNLSEKKLSVPVGTALPASSLGQIPHN